MKKLSIVMLMLLLSLSAVWGQYTISGIVLDREENNLGYASVYLDQTSYATVTDEQGFFILEDVPAGSYVIKATYLGYEPYEANLELKKDIDIDIVLSGSAFKLDAIEIKGTWAKERYPFAVTNYSEEDLQEQNTVSDVPYLLQYAPSVVVSSDAGTGVGYTGIRIRGVDPTRINVTVNGIPLNDAESQSVYWVDLPDVMNSVNEVQIQRGVGTSTNGAGAFGATINLNTNDLRMEPYAGLETGIGSFRTHKLAVELGTGLINDKFTIDGRYSLISSDGYVDRAKSALNSYYLSAARVGQKQSLRFNVFSGQEITYQSWYGLPVQYLDTLRRFNAAGIDNDFSKEEPYDNEVDNYKQTHLQLFYNKALNDHLNFELAGHYTRGHGFYEQFKSGQDLVDYGIQNDEVDESDLIRRKWLDNHFFGLVFNLDQSFKNSNLLIGGGAHDYIGRHFGEVDTVYNADVFVKDNYLYYDNDANKLDVNTYVKYQHDLGGLSVFGDMQGRMIRYRFLGKNDDGSPLDQTVNLWFFNPKVGLFYKIGPYAKTYASFAVANREPNRDDYTESSVNSRPTPERLYNSEVGFRFQTNIINAGINGYYMKYRDQLVLTGKINDVGDYTKINIPESYRMGIELDLSMEFTPWLHFGGSLTLSENKIKSFTEYVDDWDTGDQVAIQHENTDISFSPPVIASAELKWEILEWILGENSSHELDVALSDKYVGKQYLDNTMNETASLDAFNYLDAKIRYRFKKGWLKNAALELYISNLLNSEYVSNGWAYRYKTESYDPVPYDPYTKADQPNSYYYQLGLFPQATRHYMLKLRLDF